MANTIPFAITYRELETGTQGSLGDDALRQVAAVSLTLGNLPEGVIGVLPLTRITRSAAYMPAGPGISYFLHPTANAFAVVKCPTDKLEMALSFGAASVALPLEQSDFMAIASLVLNRETGEDLFKQCETGKFTIENQRVGSSLSHSGHLAKPPVLDFSRQSKPGALYSHRP